jgi:hypothetical protein
VTISFSKYLPWQGMHFLQRSTHISKTCCRLLITSKFLAKSSLFTEGKAQKSHEAIPALYGGCSSGVSPVHFFRSEQGIQFRSRHMQFLGFSNNEKGASRLSTVCSTFSRSGSSVVRSASLAKGGTSKKILPPHLHKVSTRSNKGEFTNFANGLRKYKCKLVKRSRTEPYAQGST